MTTLKNVEQVAIIRELKKDSQSSFVEKSSAYHRIVKEVKEEGKPFELKEKIIRTAIGR